MTELSKEIIASYQVRKTAKQKQAFIKYLQSKVPEMVVESKGSPKNNNLVIGSVDNAKIILGAHYDTCAKMPIPNFITPLNPFFSILYGFLICIPFFILSFVSANLLRHYTNNPIIALTVTLFILYALLALMIIGPANQHTANDNTSGVVTLCEIYAQMPAELKEKVALVFFDNEEKGLLGSAAFRKKYRKQLKNKLLINFDCVSDGDHLLFAVSKKARKALGKTIFETFIANDEKSVLIKDAEKVYYPSDQAGFPNAIAIAALKHKRILGYYTDKIHTVKDTVIDERNIVYLRDHVIQLIEKI